MSSTRVYHYVEATRYLSGKKSVHIGSCSYDYSSATFHLAVALSCSLYDHVLTSEREIRLVWKQKWSYLQMVVVFNTYLMDATMIVLAYSM